jgi:hypothetical protein
LTGDSGAPSPAGGDFFAFGSAVFAPGFAVAAGFVSFLGAAFFLDSSAIENRKAV